MRLPEAKIMEGIVHPDIWVRQKALQYFADSHSTNLEVMPLAIQAIETYGYKQVFLNRQALVHLAQSEATIDWAIGQLCLEFAEKDGMHFAVISELLSNADPRLIIPRADGILHAPRLSSEMLPELQDQLALGSWTAEQCWQELDHVAADWISGDLWDRDFDHVRRVVTALGRQGDVYADRILESLHKEITDFEDDPMIWMEIFLVMLAGQMRLKAALPLIVTKLHEGAEFLSDECVAALVTMGGDAEVEAVAHGWQKAEWAYRFSATGVLANIHSDTSVRECLQLLNQEKDLDVRTLLADALLSQFTDAGLEPIVDMVRQENYNSELIDLKAKLVAVSTIVGATFSEYPNWKAEVEKERAEFEARIAATPSFDLDLPAYTIMNASVNPAMRTDSPARIPAPFHRQEKVGRNDSCPCGSGKKFKKCCMIPSK